VVPEASTASDIAASVAAAATVGLLIAAWIAGRIAKAQLGKLTDQLAEQRTAEGRRRVYAHLSQLFDSDFIEMETDAQRLFKARPVPDDAGWAALWAQKNDNEKARILAAMNFYEVVAGEYNDANDHLIDKATADKALAIIASRMWVQAKPFVDWFRSTFGVERAFADWEELHGTVSGEEQPGAAPAAAATQTAAQAASPAVDAAPDAAPTAPTPVAPPATPAAPTTAATVGAAPQEAPPEPRVVMPRSVLVVAILWTIAIVGLFFAYIEIDAVADLFPGKIGPLPYPALWFGATGGLLVSLEGIFKYNRSWLRSYDYWHYLRPVLGAVMGGVGCLVFMVLASAAATTKMPPADAAFYDVVALALGYREANFRALLARLVDTIIVPSEAKPGASSAADSTSSP
jgi:hypothetical protein